MKTKTYCMICWKEKNGVEIKEDGVLRTLRYIKYDLLRRPRQSKRIVVCKDCYEEYKKLRKRYVGRQRLYLALGVLFIIFSFLISPFALPLGLLLFAVLYLVSLLNYVPDLEVSQDKKAKST